MIIESQCDCGEPILVETGRVDVARADGKRPHYPGQSRATTVLRCHKCKGWIADTCKDAAFD